MTYDLNTLSAARVWPYEPDFSAPYDVKRAFLTDITLSRNNRERRRALRDVPRLSTSYRTNVSGVDLQAAKHFLRVWQNKPTAVPDYSRWAATTGSSSGGASSLTIASPPAWIAESRLAILCAGSGEFELVEITDVTGSTVTLAEPLSNAWPAGSIIRPAIFGLLNGRLQGDRTTRANQQLSIQISAYPGGEPPEDEGTASTIFNGYEVFTAEPDFAQQASIEYLWPVEQVDFGYGRSAQFRPIDRGEGLVEATFSGLSPAEAQAIEQTFLRCKGMRGAFYRPSCEKDMTLAANTSSLARFDVVGTDLANDLGSAGIGQAIEIIKTDGTRIHKLITGITAVGGNSRITFSGAISLTIATTARISWMPLVRFSSDELVTSWRTFLSATIRAGFQTVKQ